MKIFYTLFALYFAAHIYIFICLRRGFGGGWWQLPVIVWLLCMAGSWLLRFGRPAVGMGDIFQNISFLWLGLLVFLCYSFIAFDLLAFAVRVPAWISKGEQLQRLTSFFTAARYVPVALAVGACLFGYALYEAQHPRVVNVTLVTAKLPPDTKPLRIVGLADVHVSSIIGPWMLNRMKTLIAEQDPDILVLSGDLVDTDTSQRDADAAIVRSFPAKLAKIAVTGNHEDYHGLERSLAFIEKSGLRVLRGDVIEVGGIAIAGVDDDRFARRFEPDTANILETVAKAPKDRFLLLLNHKPYSPEEAIGLFDLQFSGHTHGGQFWPGSLVTEAIYGKKQGLNTLTAANGSTGKLFITNGIGFWGPPVRFLTPPEIVVFTLVPEGSSSPSAAGL